MDLVDVSFEETLDKLVLINRLFYKIVDFGFSQYRIVGHWEAVT